MTAIQTIADAFPEVSYNTVVMVSTLPSLTMIVSSLIAGLVAGKKIRLKTHMLISACVLLFTGALPAVMNDFTLILVSRAVFGLALGLMTPVGNLYIFRLLKPDDRPAFVGFSLASMCVASILSTLLAGFLSAISWRYAFGITLIGVIPLIFAGIVLPNPPKSDGADAAKAGKGAMRLPRQCIPFFVLSFVFPMLLNPITVNLSSVLHNAQLGDSATTSLALSVQTASGVVSGILFGLITRKLGNAMMPLIFIFCSVGIFLLFMADGLALVFLGSALCGAWGMSLMPTVISEANRIVSADDIGLFSSYYHASGHLGNFAIPGFMTLLATAGLSDARSPVLASSVGLLAMAVITFLCVTVRRTIAAKGR
jgi:predicted MFS family arabinose efflux permease